MKDRAGREQTRRRGAGYCSDGAGWFVWDEDAGEVARAAGELRRSEANSAEIRQLLGRSSPAGPGEE
jgi:hypothetical protein